MLVGLILFQLIIQQCSCIDLSFGSMIHRSTTIFSPDQDYNTAYFVTFISLAFDSPLIISKRGNETLLLHNRDKKLDPISLYNSARLICKDGEIMIESYPSEENNEMDNNKTSPIDDHIYSILHGNDELPLQYLIPLHESTISPVLRMLLDSFSFIPTSKLPSNNLLYLLINEVYSSTYGHLNIINEEDLQECELIILHPEEKNVLFSDVSLLVNENESIDGIYKIEISDDIPGIFTTESNGEYNTQYIKLATPKLHTHSSIENSYNIDKEDGNTIKPNKNPHSGKLKKRIIELYPHADEHGLVQTEQVISLLEICSLLSTTDNLHATQFFEMIEDPLLVLLVPVIIQIIVSLVLEPIIKFLVGLIAPIIAQGLAPMIVKGIQTIQLEETKIYKHLVSSNQTHVIENVQKKLDDVVMKNLKKNEEENKKKDYPRMKSEMDSQVQNAKEKVKHAHMMLQTLDDLMLSSSSTSLLSTSTESNNGDYGPCINQRSFSQCMGAAAQAERENKMSEKCSWCISKTTYGVDAKCLTCTDAKTCEENEKNFICMPTASACSNKATQPKSSASSENTIKHDKNFMLHPKNHPSDIETAIADIVGGNALPLLVSSIHAALSPRLRSDIGKAVVREASKVVSADLVQDIALTIPQSIASLSVRGIITSTSKQLTEVITNEVTLATSQTITKALTHSPKNDFYCYYCSEHDIYCSSCYKYNDISNIEQHFIHHEANYFSNYYAWFYDGIYADYASMESQAGFINQTSLKYG